MNQAPADMTDADLKREVTDLRNRERTLRKARKPVPTTLTARITALALEQGDRWAKREGIE